MVVKGLVEIEYLQAFRSLLRWLRRELELQCCPNKMNGNSRWLKANNFTL
jgi:hypothetical protein